MRLLDFHTKQMAASRAPLRPVAAGAPVQPPAVQAQAKTSWDTALLSPPPSSKSSLALEEHVALDGMMQSFLQDGELSQKEMALYQQVRGLFTSSPAAAPGPPPAAAPVDTAPVESTPAPVQEMPAPAPAPVVKPAPTPASRPAPAAAPVAQPAPRGADGRRVQISENFDGPDGIFVHQKDFWGGKDGGRARNATWWTESGELRRQNGQGVTGSEFFRMWTRRTDLAFPKVEMDVRFDKFNGGSKEWHGINVWLNRTVQQTRSADRSLDDGANSGYMMDFVNRDGKVYILKKVPGDTRDQWKKGALSFVGGVHGKGGTYYQMASARWKPEPGKTYRFSAEVIDNKNNTATLRIQVNGKTILETVDDGKTIAGPVLTGGRVGVRGDSTQFAIDNLTISK